MKMQTKKGGQAEVWTLFGYSVAAMSLFITKQDTWRKLLLSMVVMVLAALLASWVRSRRMGACNGSHEE